MTKRYLLLAALLAACDASQPLKVKDPDVAPPGELDTPASLPFLSAGALTDFAVSFIGASDQSNNAHEKASPRWARCSRTSSPISIPTRRETS